MRIPAGLRSHTPISHTASTPNEAIESHSSDGTVPSVIVLLYWLLKSLSHTQVLISYMMGRAGHSAFKGYFSFVKYPMNKFRGLSVGASPDNKPFDGGSRDVY